MSSADFWGWQVLSLGGDTDTNAAICCGLLGALWGVESIPAAMRTAVLTCEAWRPEWLLPRGVRFSSLTKISLDIQPGQTGSSAALSFDQLRTPCDSIPSFLTLKAYSDPRLNDRSWRQTWVQDVSSRADCNSISDRDLHPEATEIRPGQKGPEGGQNGISGTVICHVPVHC